MNAPHELLEDSLRDLQAIQWESARDELCALAALRSDWDGAGADPVRPGLVSATMRFFDSAERAGQDAPTYVYLTAGGTVMAEFHSAGNVACANIREQNRVEIVYRSPGSAPRLEAERIHAPWIPPSFDAVFGIASADTVPPATCPLSYGECECNYSLAS